MIKLLAGDCRDVLRTLPADSVHCVVCSPPYYNLRDYGTALWDGGDAACDHKPNTRMRQHSTGLINSAEYCAMSFGAYRDTCGKCGAVRIDRQIGLEATPDLYLQTMVAVFREVRRVLRHDGTCWVNIGDSYNAYNGNRGASKSLSAATNDAIPALPQGHGLTTTTLANKQLLLMPARLALALQQDGWWVRSAIVWAKPNPMPESVSDRPTSAYEMVYLLTKSARYFYDADAVREEAEYGRREWANGRKLWDISGQEHSAATVKGADPSSGRNLRNVWTLATAPYSEAHFATFPPALAERCIRAGTSERGCCAQCGKPWVRVGDVSYEALGGNAGRVEAVPGVDGKKWNGGGYPRMSKHTTTTGWQPGCSHETLRCVACSVVLDTRDAIKKTSTKHRVPDVRRDVPTMGEAGEVLQPSLLRHPAEEAEADPVSSVRNGIHAAELPSEAMLGVMRSEVDGTEPLDHEGLDDQQQGLQADPEEGPSERQQDWLRDGAPAGDGEETRQALGVDRGRASQERGSAGQSDSQSGIDGEAPARRASKADLSCDVPALSDCVSDARPCPHCGSNTEWTTPDPVPCVVLDCFAGAGTTLLVADRLQRDAIGIELNVSYTEMAMQRCRADAPLFAEASMPEHPEDRQMADLFQDMAAD